MEVLGMEVTATGWRVIVASAGCLTLLAPIGAQQVDTDRTGQALQQLKLAERHVSGQTVAPVFEGWAPNPDGTAQRGSVGAGDRDQAAWRVAPSRAPCWNQRRRA